LIEIVREKSSLRSIIRFSEIAISESMALEKSDSIISNIERGIIKCTDRPEEGAFQRLGDSLSKTFEENTKRSQGQIKGIPTGSGELDSFLGGLEPGDVTVLGGRPSQGKTALATGIILHAAQLGHKCALFTMEMSKKQMTNRFLCSVARQNVHALMHGFLKHDGHIEIQKAAGIIDGLPIYMDDTSGVTPGYVKSKTRGMKRRDGVELVIIDYLQLMHTEKECRSEYDKITAISPEIKRIAKDLDVHVLALSQLSRLNKSDKTGKRKENHRPNMSDLRQSGQIEQDADNVILIHREEKYNPQPDNLGMAEIIVDKQRNGPTGIANCRFEAKCARFHDEIDNGF
jgi:replicative DNA helicase